MRRYALLTVVIAATASCTLPPPPPPTAEFLVSAGDQTYWVQSSGTTGIRVRGSPLILARSNGKYYEVFVSEIDRSFPRALFSGERVFKRELATGDSTVIYDDTSIVRMADDYHRVHPRAIPLDPDDDPEDVVDITAVGETDILNVLGPYVALEHRLSVDRGDVDDGVDDTTRTVVDLRNGNAVSLERMLHDTTLRDAAGEGGITSRRWKRDKYDVVSRYDATRRVNTLALTDHRGREWRLGLVASTYVQIFWLDRPSVDPQTRHALARAFNEATTYGGRIQQVSAPQPHTQKHLHPRLVRRNVHHPRHAGHQT